MIDISQSETHYASFSQKKLSIGKLDDSIGFLRRTLVHLSAELTPRLAGYKLEPVSLGALEIIRSNPNLSQVRLGVGISDAKIGGRPVD